MLDNMHVEEQPHHIESLDEVRRIDDKTEADDNVDLKNEPLSEVIHSLSLASIGKRKTDKDDLRLLPMLQDTKSISRVWTWSLLQRRSV